MVVISNYERILGEQPDGKEPIGQKLDGDKPVGEQPDGKEPIGREPDGKEWHKEVDEMVKKLHIRPLVRTLAFLL